MMDTTEQILTNLAAFVFASSLKAIVLIALVLLAQKVCNRFLSAGASYLLWLPVVLGLVTPVGFDTELPLTPLIVGIEDNVTVVLPARDDGLPAQDRRSGNALRLEQRDSAAILAPSYASMTATETPADSLPDTSWLQLLPYVWFAGVAAMLAGLAISGQRFSRLLQRATLAPARLQNLLQQCVRETACKRPVRLLLSTQVQTPLVARLFQPVLLLPVDIEESVTHEQLRHILLHELMHVQRGDIAANWILALLQALHWFNPVLWLAFARLRQDRELACDAATLRHLAPTDRPAYGRTLLQLNDTLHQVRVPAVALGMLQQHSPLHRRILMLARNSRRSSSGTVVTAIAFLPLAAIAFSQPAQAPREALAPADAIGAPANSIVVQAAATVSVAAAPATETVAATERTEAPAAQPVPGERMMAANDSTAVPEFPATVADDAGETVAIAANTEVPQPEAIDMRDAFAAAPPATTMAAIRVDPAPQPVAPAYAELPEIRMLAEAIAAAQAEGIDFIEEWEGIGAACNARKGRFLGALSASCQRIRTALRRGDIFNFGFECYKLTALQDELFAHYREAAALQPGLDEVEAALLTNENNLNTFCSKDTYSASYPAFAAIYADAESLEYYPPRNITTANAQLAWNDAYAWYYRKTGPNTTSMVVYGVNAATYGPLEQGAYPAPTVPLVGPSSSFPSVGGNGIPMSWQGAAAPVPQ